MLFKMFLFMNITSTDYAWIGDIIINGLSIKSMNFVSNGGTATPTLDNTIYTNSGVSYFLFRVFPVGSTGKYKIYG